jgi:LemA protein
MAILFIILAIVALVLGVLNVVSITLGIIAFVVLIAIWFVTAYNHFVRLVNHAKEAWSDIDVQLKRRYDLIPNLVNTVKGYATHESTAFEKVTAARSAAMGATSVADKAKNENMLEGALKSIFAIAEAYPDLKANTNFLELQRELSDTENKIQASRRFYNGNVRELNTGVQVFPNNIVAKIFNVSPMEYFELGAEEAAAKNPVEVKF